MSLAALAERLGDVALVRWTPALREVEAGAPSVLVRLEQRGQVRARLLREKTERVRLEPGEGEYALHHYTLALVAIEGEPEPRWIASERVVMRGV